MSFIRDNEYLASFWEHIEELRKTLFKMALVIGLGMIIPLIFYEKVFAFLTVPFENTSKSHFDQNGLHHQELIKERILNNSSVAITYVLPKNATIINPKSSLQNEDTPTYILKPGEFVEIELPKKVKLLIFGPVEGMMMALKISFWMGLAGTSPLWGYLLLKFILPALEYSTRRLIKPFLFLSFFFIAAGLSFAFFLTIPFANQYLYSFNLSIGSNFWSLAHYLDYTVILMLANAVGFELCAILLMLVHLGYLSADTLTNKRRHAIVLAFIIAAILTPPDIPTQFMLAIPLIALYEFSILYAKVIRRSECKEVELPA